MTDFQKYISALRKCAKEHENDRTPTFNIVVSDLCRDTARLLEELEQEQKTEPCEDCISRKDLLKKCVYTPIAPVIKGDSVHYEDIVFARDIINAEPIQQEPKTDYKAFAEWVAREVIDEENWEWNSPAFPEVACRKLNKLGVIDTDGKKWIYENEALEQEPTTEEDVLVTTTGGSEMPIVYYPQVEGITPTVVIPDSTPDKMTTQQTIDQLNDIIEIAGDRECNDVEIDAFREEAIKRAIKVLQKPKTSIAKIEEDIQDYKDTFRSREKTVDEVLDDVLDIISKYRE